MIWQEEAVIGVHVSDMRLVLQVPSLTELALSLRNSW